MEYGQTGAGQGQGSGGDEHEEITRAVREGVWPDDLKGRMGLFGDKVSGRVPLGVDAPNKSTRKVIGGAGKLLTVIWFGVLGVILTLFGALMVWAGFADAFDWKVAGIGAIVLAVGVLGLVRAYKAWLLLRAITKA